MNSQCEKINKKKHLQGTHATFVLILSDRADVIAYANKQIPLSHAYRHFPDKGTCAKDPWHTLVFIRNQITSNQGLSIRNFQ